MIPAYQGGHWRRSGIPVERLLDELLGSLARQTLARSRFEVVLVHTRDDDPGARAAARHDDRLTIRRVRYRPAGGGAAAARNLGWRAARGRAVAFVDADCRAEPGWLEAVTARLDAEADALGVEGLTRTEPEAVTPFTHQVVNLSGGQFPSCNVCYRRAVLERVGGFDERFPYGHEDTDLSIRVRRLGPVPFSPEAVVVHPPIPTRPLQLVRRARLWRNELLLYHKDPADYLRRKRHDPLITIYYHLGLVCLFRGLWEHRRWLRRDPPLYLFYLLAMIAQRLLLTGLLFSFVSERLSSSWPADSAAGSAGRAPAADPRGE